MRSDLVERYDLRVPRYTSYPTAPHFSEAIGPRDHAAWLAALSSTEPLSLYLHVPFCDTLCWFCGCHTKVVRRYRPVADYLDILLSEALLVADTLPARFQLSHVQWGGGSPTMLTGDDWALAMDTIRERFDIREEAEIAVELDPRTATPEYVAALARAGVNRASIGVQDFDPEVQRAINRIQSFETTRQVVDWLNEAGIHKLNIDLLYGLPHQTTERVIETVRKAVRLAPTRVALFGYAHVPWMKSHQRLIDEAALPDVRARFEQAEAAAEQLIASGYVRIGLDHFARPDDPLFRAAQSGGVRRNFQGYTTDAAPALIGLGASAISALPQGYAQNTPSNRDYGRAVRSRRLPTARGIALSADDRLRRAVIETLMCELTADVGSLCRAHGQPVDALDDGCERLRPLVADGWISVTDRKVAISEDGRAFVRLAAAAFDSYLASGQKRYSRAV